MLSFKALSEKKSAVKINPKLNDLKEGEKEGHEGMEKSHGEDCDCMKCEKKRRKGKESDPEIATESAVPGQPAERLGAVTAIPKDQQDAARERLLAKTKAIRDKKKIREEIEIEEGMTLKQFKTNRKTNERRAASADAEKRGHVGKEWHNTGRKYSPDEAKSRRANMSDDDRAARKRASIDPDDDRDENTYSADRTKNPKKQRKQKAMGELTTKKEQVSYDSQEEVSKESNQSIAETETLLTFGEFQEARNAYAVGMAKAQEITGDTPPLKKSTIKKAHEIAKAIKKEEVELVDERTRYAKETGKDPQTGKPSEKGGTLGGDDRHAQVMRHMNKQMRKTGGMMSSRGNAIKPQGKKKVKGAKPSFKMEPTPVDKIKAKLARKRAPKPDIGSRFD